MRVPNLKELLVKKTGNTIKFIPVATSTNEVTTGWKRVLFGENASFDTMNRPEDLLGLGSSFGLGEIFVSNMEKDEIKDILNFTEEDLKLFALGTDKIFSYNPTKEEFNYLCKLVFAEAGDQGAVGQTMVANVVLNRVENGGFGGKDIISVCTQPSQFSPVKNGVPCILNKQKKWIPVTDKMLTDELKAAVKFAFEKDLTIEPLKKTAEKLGIKDEKYWKGGALFFHAPSACSEEALKNRENIKVKFQHRGHIFYRIW